MAAGNGSPAAVAGMWWSVSKAGEFKGETPNAQPGYAEATAWQACNAQLRRRSLS